MFTKTASFYDAIYAARGKDYAAEAAWLRAAYRSIAKPGSRLLDVACGTGMHLSELRGYFAVEGLDADPGMIAIARERLPGVPLHTARMQDFTIEGRVTIVQCLFSSIGYVADEKELRATIKRFAEVLEPGGMVVVEPWFTPAQWRDDHLDAVFVDQPDLKIARMSTNERYGTTSVVRYQYLVGEVTGLSSFAETHALRLFTEAQYREAFVAAGLRVREERTDLFTRGLYIGTR
ncbi:MAG: class I SAM-dependent methyltransferase [Candidatus Velthaea sp.]|jgi:ubiquinone/menaquinone biosynthesis C-methylase UbiE